MPIRLIDKLHICENCLNTKFEFSRGRFCGLTNEKPTFDEVCNLFEKKQTEVKSVEKKPLRKKTKEQIFKEKKIALGALILVEFIVTFIFDASWGFEKDFGLMLIFIVIPLSLIINTSIAFLLLFIKRGYSLIFILNAFISTIMFLLYVYFRQNY